MLKLHNLTKSFKGKMVLNNVSLKIQQGSIEVFLGHSGVGKSTLLRVLNNLETLDSGTIYLDDKEIDLNAIHQTHQIGMVFQNFNLFDHLTVHKNITLVLEKIHKQTFADACATADALLEKFKLTEKAHSSISQLSGGQKQRLSIARALAIKPRILCMDEPTSALDPSLTNHVAKLIQSLAHDGYTILVATHDMKLLEYLNGTIHLMDRGIIVESANVIEFKKKPKAFNHISHFIEGN